MPPLWICTNISKLNIWCFLVNYRTDLVSQNGFEPFTNPCRVELLAMCVALTVDETMAWRLGIEPRTYGFGIRCSTNWTTFIFENGGEYRIWTCGAWRRFCLANRCIRPLYQFSLRPHNEDLYPNYSKWDLCGMKSLAVFYTSIYGLLT